MILRKCSAFLLMLAAAAPAQADSDCQARSQTADEKKLVQALTSATRLLPKASSGWQGEEAVAEDPVFCSNVDYRGSPKLLDSSVRFQRMDSEEQAQRNAEQIAAAVQKSGQPSPELIDRLFNTDRVADVRIELNAESASCAGRRRALVVPNAQAWLCQIGWNRDGRLDDQQQGEQRYNSQIVVLFGPWRSEASNPEDAILFNAQFKPALPYTAVQTLALTINADEARAQALLKQMNTAALAALVGR